VAGSFQRTGAVYRPYIARWNANDGWRSLGPDLDGPVHALATDGSSLYLAGEFTRAGSQTLNGVARWPGGSSYLSLGAGMNGGVWSLSYAGGVLYAGGSFSTANGQPAANVAQWNGGPWSPLGSGTDAQVRALAATSSEVFAGGAFTRSGDKTAAHLGRFSTSNLVSACAFEQGWNLVSVPYLTANGGLMTPATWHPNVGSALFGYDPSAGYVTSPTLDNGSAYWAFYGNRAVESVDGGLVPVANRTIPVTAGWNLIGGFDGPIDVSDLSPSSLVGSPLYGFEGLYRPADVLQPCKGYWLFATGDGSLSVSASNQTAQPLAKTAEASVWDRLQVRTETGLIHTLLLAPAGTDVDWFKAPPLSPARAFDVRFDSDRTAAALGQAHQVDISGTTGPVTLTATRALWAEIDGARTLLEPGAPITLDAAPSALRILAADTPERFGFAGLYPNPSSTSAHVRFELNEDAQVQLDVFDVLGRRVARLADAPYEAGLHEVAFPSARLTAGTYLLRLTAGPRVAVQRAVVAR
ncbi:MAG: T9SS type A sorting domain-containing protein, partial [Bacteroidota bacterium]